MSNTTTSQRHNPVETNFDSLTDIVPDFPLENNEAVLVTETPGKNRVLIPSAIAPSKNARYNIILKGFDALGENELGPIIKPVTSVTRNLSISQFEDLIHRETVITKSEYTIKTWCAEGTLYFDGASRGNPGDAATGFVLESTVLDEELSESEYIGEHTNNYAEYRALLAGLQKAREIGVTNITIHGDSELIIKQVTGEYACNAPTLKPVLKDVHSELKKFESWTISHVPREENNLADNVANRALDTN